MKIIHITDTHYGQKSEAIYGKEPAFALQEAIKSINTLHKDAEFCIITGDLVHNGHEKAYEYLHEDLSKLQIPYYLIVGNHDDRENVVKYFTDLKKDEHGFIQYSFTCKDRVFIMLDSIKKGAYGGFFCPLRQEWLQKQITLYQDKDIYLCMHHAPFNTGLKAMDKIRLNKEDSKSLYKIVSSHKNIKHLFLGHYHRPISGKWGEVSFSTLRGMNHQVKFDLYSNEVYGTFEEPQYSIVLIDEDEPNLIVTHYHDFLHSEILNLKL